MQIGIPKEVYPDERRVAASPDVIRKYVEQGFTVVVETGAGAAASFTDEALKTAGASVAEDAAGVWSTSDIILKVRAPMAHPQTGKHEVELMRTGGTLISFIYPAQNKDLLEKLAARSATVLAVDCIPRTTRAQAADALSSMGNIAGYKAVVEAANAYGSFFTGQITAAGKVPPARVLIIGAGVAGLAAIGAARGLGAHVRAFDTRPAVRDQVTSLGADFLEVTIQESGDGGGGYAKEMSPEFIKAEMALFAAQAREVDIIITTALIPGKPAPKLITTEMVESMKPGSVIVDLASEQGGNCELTQPGKLHVHNGVKILGYSDLPSRLSTTASQLYATNLLNFLNIMGGHKAYTVNLEDEVVRGALVLHNGVVTWPPPPRAPAAPVAAAPKPAPVVAPVEVHTASPTRGPARRSFIYEAVALLSLTAWTYAMMSMKGTASVEAQNFVQHATVFVLACFVGWQVVWNVTPALHTPLMSVTNAISGIIILGGMLQAHGEVTSSAAILGLAAILLATVNIAGGFLVTERMLRMFRK